jgi:hypothetical protein
MPTEPTDSPPIESPHSWRSLAHWKKRLIAIGAVVAVVATLLGNLEKIIDTGKKAYSFVVPSVEISPGIIGSDNNAMAAEFVFMNTGALPLFGNEIGCNISAANTRVNSDDNFIISPGRDNTQFVNRLDPGKPVTRNCGELLSNLFGVVALYPAHLQLNCHQNGPPSGNILAGLLKQHSSELEGPTGISRYSLTTHRALPGFLPGLLACHVPEL